MPTIIYKRRSRQQAATTARPARVTAKPAAAEVATERGPSGAGHGLYDSSPRLREALAQMQADMDALNGKPPRAKPSGGH